MATKKPESKQSPKDKGASSGPEFSLVEKAGFTPLRSIDTVDGKVVEIDPSDVSGRKAATLFPDDGVDAILEVKVAGTHILGVDPNSVEAHAFIGRLSAALAGDGVSVSLGRDDEEVNAVLLRAHRCDRSSSSVSELLGVLDRHGQHLADWLAGLEDAASQSLEEHFQPQLGALDLTKVEGKPRMVPTLDPSRIQQMYELSEGLKG